VDGPRGPLVVRFGAMGDLINLTSMLQTLATAWDAPCDVVTGRDAPATVVAGVKAVGEVRALRSRPHRSPGYGQSFQLPALSASFYPLNLSRMAGGGEGGRPNSLPTFYHLPPPNCHLPFAFTN
jgi:hypothetical protein